MAGCAARVCGRAQRELPRYKSEPVSFPAYPYALNASTEAFGFVIVSITGALRRFCQIERRPKNALPFV
jgi:hypothetical protein